MLEYFWIIVWAPLYPVVGSEKLLLRPRLLLDPQYTFGKIVDNFKSLRDLASFLRIEKIIKYFSSSADIRLISAYCELLINVTGQCPQGSSVVHIICITCKLESFEESDNRNNFFGIGVLCLKLRLDFLVKFNNIARHFIFVFG